MIRPLALVWMGIVIGVSFLATPVKFTADSLTRPVALDVGRATFHALAYLEWVLAALLVIAALASSFLINPLQHWTDAGSGTAPAAATAGGPPNLVCQIPRSAPFTTWSPLASPVDLSLFGTPVWPRPFCQITKSDPSTMASLLKSELFVGGVTPLDTNSTPRNTVFTAAVANVVAVALADPAAAVEALVTAFAEALR